VVKPGCNPAGLSVTQTLVLHGARLIRRSSLQGTSKDHAFYSSIPCRKQTIQTTSFIADICLRTSS